MKKLLCMLCVLALAVGLFPAARAAAPTLSAGGWFESLYAELSGVTDSQITAVSYSGTMNGALAGDDLKYLVRDVDGVVRIDIPGLKAGTYSLTVTVDGKDYTQSNIQVMAYDRSGFAHWNHTAGVGAYNDDGTLKKNALVLYVTEGNKETVTFKSSKGTITGIGKILNNAKDNNNIFKALFQTDKRPLVVRFIGTVTAPTGLTTQSYKQDSKGEWDGDNGYMACMKNGANVTLEGIGADATIDGWGFDWGVNTSAYESDNNLGKNFEVRNLTFRNAPEDCASAGGADVDKAPVEHIWIHNCSFYVPKIPLLQSPNTSSEPYTWVTDKQEGDGACDFKLGKYMTMSYNYFEGYHKTSLLGGGDTQKQYHITWHHNWWKGCNQRGPLCRQADMHIYNNRYDGQTGYCMSLRANCYIFSEFNSFVGGTKNPVVDEKSGGVCKSYQDDFSGAKGTNNAKIVQNKAEKVSNNNLYPDFDTNSSLSYIPTKDYQLDTVADAKTKIDAYAGVMKAAAEIVTPGHTHAWGNWEPVKAATCTEAGEKKRTCGNPDCPVSGGVQTEVIAALGHNYVNGVCSRCQDRFAGKTYVLTGNDVFASMAETPVPNMPMAADGTNAGSYIADKDTSGKGGTDNAFTLLYGAKSRLDPNEKSFADGFKGTHRINFSGAAGTTGNAIRFTTQGTATVKVWWVGAVGANELTEKDPRPMVILDDGGKEIALSETVANNTSRNISTLELPGAGTYYLGGKGGKNFIYKVEVAVHGAAPDPGPAPDTGLANGNLGENGELTWQIGDDGELNVTGEITAGQMVLAAQYDTEGCFTGLAWITAQERTAQVDVQAAKIKLFWLEDVMPLCEAVTAVEK